MRRQRARPRPVDDETWPRESRELVQVDHGPAVNTHHFVPSETSINVLLMLVAVGSGASSVTVVVPAGVPTGVTKQRSCVALFALMRLTANRRPALLAALGSEMVTPGAPVLAALQKIMKSVAGLIV